MRRALVLIATIATSLALAAPALAPAATARGGGEVERELSFRLPSVDGFKIEVNVSNNDGDVSANLIVSKGPQVAYYSTPAKITAKRVTARFGTQGELDFRLVPKGSETARCLGGTEGKGLEEFEGEVEFEGTFSFTGENEYIHLEADHAKGDVHVFPAPKGCGSPRRARRARRVVPYHPSYSAEGATLQARAGSRAKGVIREVSVYDDGPRGRRRVGVFGLLAELREGMSVIRAVQLAAPRSAFRWDLDAGTATVRPPAPFTGSATFTRHGGNGHGAWIGSLGMPIFGGEPVELSGNEFRAYMHKGVQQDE
jgi:hypothetical protein